MEIKFDLTVLSVRIIAFIIIPDSSSRLPIFYALTSQLHTTALLSTTSAAVSSLECATDGKKCKIIWKDGEQSTYHAVWLRDNCHCPECWDSGFDMKIVLDTKEFRGDVRLRSVKLEGLSQSYSFGYSTLLSIFSLCNGGV